MGQEPAQVQHGEGVEEPRAGMQLPPLQAPWPPPMQGELCVPLTVLSQPSLTSSDPHPLAHPQAPESRDCALTKGSQPDLAPSWNPVCPSGPEERPGTGRVKSTPLGQRVQPRKDARIPGQVTSGGCRELATGQEGGRAGRGPWTPSQSPHRS